MRIPFPERVALDRVALFTVALFLIQTVEGTELYFSIGCSAFILIAALAFNSAGGLTRASGAYIFSYSLLVFIIGICYKAFLGEPAQSNLLAPHTDINAYVGSIAAMYAAVIVSRRFRRQSGLLQNVLDDSRMYRASVGCIAFGIAGGFLIDLLGESASKLLSAFNQLNQLIPLGIIIGATYEIRRSGGTRSTNSIMAVGAIYLFVLGGVLNFSKQAMLTPLYCWLLPVCALRYRLSAWQIISLLLATFVMFHYLTPYAQYGRSQVPETPTLGQRIDVATRLLEHPEETRRAYEEVENAAPDQRGLSAYFNTPQGFWERLQFISVDDKLIDITDRGGVFGLLPIKLAFIDIVPHVIWPNKPSLNIGNAYAHEITGEAQGEGDTTTGIAFSPTAEAYHLAKWPGILVLAPVLWCTLFIVFDSLLGDLRNTPWGLLALAVISHAAPEGGIVVVINLFSLGVELLVFCAFFAAWFGPVFAIPILGPDRSGSRRLAHTSGLTATLTNRP